MTNHVRTLLLNRPGAEAYPPDYPGEEYVPPDYRERALTPGLAEARRLLFGAAPDRACLNLWLARYLAALDAVPSAAPFVTDADARRTDRPARGDLFSWLLGGPRVQALAGTAALQALGHWPASGGDRLYRSWDLTVGGGGTSLAAAYADDLGVPRSDTLGLTPSGGVALAGLPGGALQARFEATPGASWRVSWLAVPTEGLADRARAAADRLPGSAREELFGGAASEPFKSFEAMWRTHPDLLGRLCGVLLALAKRTEAL